MNRTWNQTFGKSTSASGPAEYEGNAHPPAAHGSNLLIAALEREAFNRSHTQPELAVAIGVHPAHWYRLRAHPEHLSRCERGTLESIAVYLGWPVGRVLLASGMVALQDFEILLGGDSFVSSCIKEIEASPFGAGLVHSLREATRDHQILVAELFSSLRAQSARIERIEEGLKR